jgi:hypothetical protein
VFVLFPGVSVMPGRIILLERRRHQRACSQSTWTQLRSDLGQIWLRRSAQNRRRSSAPSRIWRLSRDQRWSGYEVQDGHGIC